MAAFLKAGEYRKAPWISETAMPRERSSGTSPHGKVRVFMNPQLVESLKGGRDGFKDMATGMDHPPHDRYSMAVKELWDDAGTKQEGVAAMFKADEGKGMMTWVYFCEGPMGRCVTSASPVSSPIHGRGTTVGCGFCHGGFIYTKAP
jgi:hypothetical protein